MNSPSPHMVKPANLLNHFSLGTSGSVSYQRARRTICPHDIFRVRIRASIWAISGLGSLLRRILGARFAAVKPSLDLLLQPVGLRGVFCFHHSLGQLPKFVGGKRTALSHLSSKLDYPGLF